MTQGRSIRLFLVDGIPGGIITAEIMNWTGHVMIAPRSKLPDLVQRSESGRTGVYVLTGTDPEGGFKPLAYVGETDNVGKRLAQHNKDDTKDFWEQTCVITSKDQNLTKAHARYLESRLISIANEVGRSKLENGTAPEFGLLPEADLSDMEFFIEQLRIVLPVLGLEFLRDQTKPAIQSIAASNKAASLVTDTEAPSFSLFFKKEDLRAEAREVDGAFVVLAGSQARESWVGVTGASYGNLRQQLVESGILMPDGKAHRYFRQDYAFKSPSAASAVILGRHDNGRTTWRLKGTDKTYADWQEERVEAVALVGGDE